MVRPPAGRGKSHNRPRRVKSLRPKGIWRSSRSPSLGAAADRIVGPFGSEVKACDTRLNNLPAGLRPGGAEPDG
jgi:hypothetical protein